MIDVEIMLCAIPVLFGILALLMMMLNELDAKKYHHDKMRHENLLEKIRFMKQANEDTITCLDHARWELDEKLRALQKSVEPEQPIEEQTRRIVFSKDKPR